MEETFEGFEVSLHEAWGFGSFKFNNLGNKNTATANNEIGVNDRSWATRRKSYADEQINIKNYMDHRDFLTKH